MLVIGYVALCLIVLVPLGTIAVKGSIDAGRQARAEEGEMITRTYYPIAVRDRITNATRVIGYSDTRVMPPHTEYRTAAEEVIFLDPVQML